MIFFGNVWELFLLWVGLFTSPFKNITVLWILVPIWISWFFTEFFQEKEGTHFGNAITNGAIPIWVGIDWTRYLTTQLTNGAVIENGIMKFILCGLIGIYGIIVIAQGLKANGFAHFGGRIRVITYLFVTLTPVIYGVIEFSWMLLVSIVVFFPVFYFFIELIAKLTPDSKALKADLDADAPKDGLNNSKDPFGTPSTSPTSNDPFASLSSSNSYNNSMNSFAASQPGTNGQSTPQMSNNNQMNQQKPIRPVTNPQFGSLPQFPSQNTNTYKP